MTAALTGDNTASARRTAVINALKKSPFWAHRGTLRKASPKFDAVVKNINQIIELKKKTKDEDGPPDGSQVRHMLLFSDSQLSAFLLFMLLTELYTKDIQLIYVHGGIAPVDRSKMLEEVNTPCSPGGLNKVVISNFNLIGQGYNLQRANYAIITEMPRSQTVQRQAFGRVDRRGQAQKVVLLQLYDQRNLVEKVRYVRGKARAELQNAAHSLSEVKLDEFLQ